MKRANRNRKVPFVTEAWNIYKGLIYLLPEELGNQLIIAYNEVRIFNSMITYDIANRDSHSQTLGDESYVAMALDWTVSDIDDQANNVRAAFKNVEQHLKNVAQSTNE